MNELNRLNNLFHQYSTSDVVEAVKSTEAFANEVFDIRTSDSRRYFLKVLKDQDSSAIANEVRMQKRLLKAGIKTPQYLEVNQNEYVGNYGGERFLVSEYIPGTSPKAVTLRLVEDFGATLAKLHDGLEGIEIPESSMQWLNPEKVRADIATYHGEAESQIKKLLQYGETIFSNALPYAVIHGDLWLSNVFAENDHITTVFDLETAENTVRLVDIARAYTSLRFNSKFTEQEVIDHLVAGYNSIASQILTMAEMDNIKKAIAYVCGACATWHAVHGTRYRDPYINLGDEAMMIDNPG